MYLLHRSNLRNPANVRRCSKYYAVCVYPLFLDPAFIAPDFFTVQSGSPIVKEKNCRKKPEAARIVDASQFVSRNILDEIDNTVAEKSSECETDKTSPTTEEEDQHIRSVSCLLT